MPPKAAMEAREFIHVRLHNKGKCIYKGQDTTALIFSKKHLIGLYLQCLMGRNEIMEHQECSDEKSEIYERIFRLENVDVLFQCLLMDQVRWVDGKLCIPFCTVYQLFKD